jgi:hypothetical protein
MGGGHMGLNRDPAPMWTWGLGAHVMRPTPRSRLDGWMDVCGGMGLCVSQLSVTLLLHCKNCICFPRHEHVSQSTLQRLSH